MAMTAGFEAGWMILHCDGGPESSKSCRVSTRFHFVTDGCERAGQRQSIAAPGVHTASALRGDALPLASLCTEVVDD